MSNTISEFIQVFVQIEKLFTECKIELETNEKFKNVSNASKFISYHSNENPAISFFINADLNEYLNNDLHCLGLSFTIFKKDEFWIFEGEVGWSSFDNGFEEENSISKEYKSINLLLQDILKNIDQLLIFYKKLIPQISMTKPSGKR